MLSVWGYSILSVLLVSAVSLIGILTLSLTVERMRKILFVLVSFAAGALLGDAFIHLLPEATEERGFTITISLSILAGIALFFVMEKIIHWQHCHHPAQEHHPHPFVFMNLVGDAVHNLLDGLIIGASYLVSIPLGVATTIAVVAHEIPQEIGDFGVLLHGGFSRNRALFMNFLTASTAVMGVIAALLLDQQMENIPLILVPFAAGGFIYIAGTDLIPELHKEVKVSKSILQFVAFILGIATMLALLRIE